ncbi:uncharacterized protein TRIADDRAFT_58600 [Trichoplax adhaerens]|uniref:RNA helicase n=1 Tax=Trichoplax adhaerens TaxID=10228 RepID=B3S353_TRIAD|nr:hypothetical protein TRIADDRAFT_58600 [Trichoplax adhaerens]EDV22910.1 hypothetical protein TRIADDRAFT_58600 [Trichoplax adhaerens]|eukprot:XP_002114776.1 hypothetical protein TRIADDRAFT_58600 [Trichoplax adhaerens]
MRLSQLVSSIQLSHQLYHRSKFVFSPSVNGLLSSVRRYCSDGDGKDNKQGRKLNSTVPLNNSAIKLLLKELYKDNGFKHKLKVHKIEDDLLAKVARKFRSKAISKNNRELNETFIRVRNGEDKVMALWPYFLKYAKKEYPLIGCIKDLLYHSNFRSPVSWYQEARNIAPRKIIYHAGPTNSGKTYHALHKFFKAEKAIYCCPLRLLAHEIYRRSLEANVKCDLITGEERLYVDPNGFSSQHVSCTVEMANINEHYDIGIIDEIQMIKDDLRGFAWTRALLGLCAFELHLCGDPSGIDLIRKLADSCGDEFEVQRYDRLVPLSVQKNSFDGKLSNVTKGDCVVAFSRKELFKLKYSVESKTDHKCAIIYGGLPSVTRAHQADLFNDPNNDYNVLVASDAIGMGLNLNIKRIIFNSLMKFDGLEITSLTPSHARQVAGRAGRFRSDFNIGEITTLFVDDLPIIQRLLDTPIEPIQRAGLGLTWSDVELFSYYLPEASFTDILDLFSNLVKVGDKFFICRNEEFKNVAAIVDTVEGLLLKEKYIFCLAPIDHRNPLMSSAVLKFATHVGKRTSITDASLKELIPYPFKMPDDEEKLFTLEAVYDILDLYLWLRFPDYFVNYHEVCRLQKELESVISKFLASPRKRKIVSSSAYRNYRSNTVKFPFKLSSVDEREVVSDVKKRRS